MRGQDQLLEKLKIQAEDVAYAALHDTLFDVEEELTKYDSAVLSGDKLQTALVELDVHKNSIDTSYNTLLDAAISQFTFLAGSSSSWELRTGRTGPTVIALPRLQTALKNGAKTRPRLLYSTIGLCLSVRSVVMMIDVSTYEGAYFMGDKLRHVVQLSLVPRA